MVKVILRWDFFLFLSISLFLPIATDRMASRGPSPVRDQSTADESDHNSGVVTFRHPLQEIQNVIRQEAPEDQLHSTPHLVDHPERGDGAPEFHGDVRPRTNIAQGGGDRAPTPRNYHPAPDRTPDEFQPRFRHDHTPSLHDFQHVPVHTLDDMPARLRQDQTPRPNDFPPAPGRPLDDFPTRLRRDPTPARRGYQPAHDPMVDGFPARMRSEQTPRYEDRGDFQRRLGFGMGRPDRPVVKPERFDGSEDWATYIQHFEWVAEVNGWNEYDKAKFLTVSVTGTARQILAAVSRDRLLDYQTIVRTLRSRFDPVGRLELHRIQLKNRVRNADESLSDLADDVRRLVDRVFADIPFGAREKLARDCFIDALTDSEMRTRIIQMRTSNIQEAMEVAIELEALSRAEIERNPPSKKVRELGQMVQPSTEETVRDIVSKELSKIRKELEDAHRPNYRSQGNSDRRCFNCGSPSHFVRDCKAPKKSFGDRQSGN